MASALNKRQQARNERALQDLIKTVPGNGACADCGARNPGWASWSLGIFLCMRCAALHRKLGTHISKVKSLSMDKWDNSQVDNMKRIGNLESNKTYNPRNIKPSIPIDIDEVDSAMERYIRAKYEQRIYLNDSRPGTRQNTGSTSSDDRPPPLPPKPTNRFGLGLRKTTPASQNRSPPVSPGIEAYGQDTSPPRVNKPSRVFGSNIQTSGDGLDSKLSTLRDMGFPDDKRNSTVLKGLNGNLDRTVEALIRLGEQNPVKSRGSTPTPPTKPVTNGISFESTNIAPAPSSTNPFDAFDAPAQTSQQQPQQPTPIQTQQTSYGVVSVQPTHASNSYNPFLSQAPQGQAQQQISQQGFSYQQNPWEQQQQQNLEQSFQGMQLSNQQPQQPLFPNRTGGYGQSQPSQQVQTNPYHQSFTPPPMPQIPEQYSAFFAAPQPQYQSMSNPSSPGNPFLRSTRSQMFTSTNLASSNPFGQSMLQQQPTQQQQQQQQQPQQQQPQFQQQAQQQPQFQQQQAQQQVQQPQFQQQQAQQQYQQPAASNPWSMQQPNQVSTQASNPWQSQQQGFQTQQDPHQNYQAQQSSFQNQQQDPHQNYQTQQQNFQNQQQLYQQQSSNPFDKTAILSLYNQPNSTPQQGEQQQAASTPASASTPTASMPRSNPFGGGSGTAQGQPLSAVQSPGVRHVSNESVDFAGLMGGRHSPDAFSGLSSSFRR